MVATQLTNEGWLKGSEILGTWTNKADLVEDLVDGIEVVTDVVANTRDGDDVIKSKSSTVGIRVFNCGVIGTGRGNDTIESDAAGVGIVNEGEIDTGIGNDIIRGSAGGAGISNSGLINTGLGDDEILAASGGDGLNNDGQIRTGAGNDTVTGSGRFRGLINNGELETGIGDDRVSGGGRDGGILNSGTIATGVGDDFVEGGAWFTGITNNTESTIDTGAGNDRITSSISTATGSGLLNNGTIRTGAGDDIVDSLAGGMGGTGTIQLDAGDDLIRGFGSQLVRGGQGLDTAELGIALTGIISLGSTSRNSIDITANNRPGPGGQTVTMSFLNVERFVFSSGETLSLQALQGMIH